MSIFSWIRKQIFDPVREVSNANNSPEHLSINRPKHNDAQPHNNQTNVPGKRLMHPLEEGLLPGEVILLDWANHKSETASIPAYFKYEYGLNATKDRHNLIRLGYLTVASPSESLKSLRVPELKDILRSNGQKVTGKKLDLIQRITDNVDENLYSDAITTSSLVSTPAGNKLLEKYSHLVWAHKHNSKYGIINVANALTPSIERMQSDYDHSRSQAGLTEEFQAELKYYDTGSYEILGSLDTSTCEKCGSMDGKVFQVSHAKPGISLPPFREGCRCAIAPHISGLPASGKRMARNPKTGKSEYIPFKNYNEWHKDVVQKYGDEIFR